MSDHVTADLGINPDQVHRGRLVLRNKRMSVVTRSHPRLKDILGIEFEQLFQEFAGHQPLNEQASGKLDGRRFANSLLLASDVSFSQKLRLVRYQAFAT